MRELVPLLPALPFAGALVLFLFGRKLPDRVVALVGAGSVGTAAALAVALGVDFASTGDAAWRTELWRWIPAGDLSVSIGFALDRLSVVMVLVVTGVGFLIHLYSVEYMAGDGAYARFFAELNLFVASMLVLVLADDLLLLYLGWEGVGLSSWLLIGFWFRDPANGRAARKAFLVTRIGDAGMAVGLLVLYAAYGTWSIPGLEGAAVAGAATTAAAWLLLAGAIGKSAQLPLQTWLPDAMAGPTPVSALIHAATMVTAGVYLIARLDRLFLLAPAVLAAVAVIGAATLLYAGFAAFAQTDIKRILAYSTISQLGYMFLALGSGAFAAGIFHLVTHAFFKALLFLGAGVVIHAMGGEHDVRKMGGLGRRLPLTFFAMLAAAAALSGFPLVTAGFWSKDAILAAAWHASPWLFAAGLAGVLLTGLYAFRLVFLVFGGEAEREVERRPGWAIGIPLAVLGLLSLAGGFLPVESFLHGAVAGGSGGESGFVLPLASSVVALAGIGLAAVWFLRRRREVADLVGAGPARFLLSGLGFDRFYEVVLVRPFLALTRALRRDPIDAAVSGVAAAARAGHRAAAAAQTGRIGWYAAAIVFGAALVVGLGVLA